MVCIRETGPVAKIGMAQFRVGTAPMKMGEGYRPVYICIG